MKLKHEFSFEVFELFLVYFKKNFYKTSSSTIVTLVLSINCVAASNTNTDAVPQSNLLNYEQKLDANDKKAPVIEMIESEQNEGDKQSFFKYGSSLTFRSGAAANFKKLNGDPPNSEIPAVFGLQYMQNSKSSTHREYGFDLINADDPLFYIHAGLKHIFDHTDYFRPYYKLGLAMRFDKGDHLETPFDFKSYSLAASIGLENFVKDPSSFRVDLDLRAGEKDFLILLCLGWSYAFN